MNEYNFLNSIYKTSEMGIVGIDDVIEKTKTLELSNLLLEQRKDYEVILKKCNKLLKENEFTKKKLGNAAKVSSKIMANMKVTLDNSDSCIAKLMIEGTNKGIIKMTKFLNKLKRDNNIKKLGEDLLNIMNTNLENLKSYL